MPNLATRQGELFALRRSDLTITRDDQNRITADTVFVRRSVVRSKQPDGTVLAHEDDPKSDAGIRRIAVPPHILADHDHQLTRYAQHGDTGLMFPTSRGGYLHPSILYGEPPDTRRANASKGSGFYRARTTIGHPLLKWQPFATTPSPAPSTPEPPRQNSSSPTATPTSPAQPSTNMLTKDATNRSPQPCPNARQSCEQT